MRYPFLTVVTLLLFSNCKKNPDRPHVDPPSPYTPIPIATPVNTSLVAYTINNVQTVDEVDIEMDNTSFDYSDKYKYFNLDNITTDKYSTTILSRGTHTTSNILDVPKTLPVTASSKNYIDVEILHPTLVELSNLATETYDLPGNGKITLPPFAFEPPSGAVNAVANFAYLHPSIIDYAASLPCYPAGDDNNKRWFLNSYGIYFIVPGAKDIRSTDTTILQLAIQPAQAASAPDSIPVWTLSNLGHLWQKNGYAKRSGSYYIKRVDHNGFWNFAAPVDGVYITLQLRSNSGIPVPNTRVVIKNNMGEVADGRTDADGNALLFVPSNENLKLNIINDHVVNGISIPLKEEDLGSFSTSTVKTFTMQDRVDLVTIYGKAFNCDGTPLKSGTAVLSSSYQIAAKDAYATSIVDGAFKFMNWITWNYDLGTVVLKDNSGKAMDTTNIMLGVNYPDRPYRIDMNIYACKNAPQLFCNYRIDTTSYSISVNATANSPVLTEAYTDLSYPNIITIDNNGQGIIFQGYFPEVGGNYFYYSSVQGLPTGLKINGVDYAFDPRSEITITRRDPDYGGIVEGRFSVNYGGTHNISGNFRVKRVSYK